MPETPEQYPSWQEEVLRRLKYAIKQRKEQGGQVNAEGRKLLDVAVFEALVACKEADIGEEAEKLLEEAFGPKEKREGGRKPESELPG